MIKSFLTLAALAAAAVAIAQTDHDNIDSGRPLSFDDAEPVPFMSRGLEFGIRSNFYRTRYTAFEVPIDFVYGAFMDTQVEVGTGYRFGSRQSSRLSPIDLGILHSFRREIRNSPALAIKAEAELPTERGEEAAYRVRGILSKHAGQYDRLHLNLDLDFAPNARPRLGAMLGYTTPIGYPTHFDTTGLAEIGIRQGENRGQDPTFLFGVGLRRQMNPTTVFDIGLQSELAARGGTSVPLRLVAGLSMSF